MRHNKVVGEFRVTHSERLAKISHAALTAVGAGLLMLSAPAMAVDYHWMGGSGNYVDTVNWNTCPPGTCNPASIAPGYGDQVLFDLADGSVLFPVAANDLQDVFVAGTTTTFDMNGAAGNNDVVRADTIKIGLGSAYNSNTTSTLNVTNGRLVMQEGIIVGAEFGHTGYLNVTNGGDINMLGLGANLIIGTSSSGSYSAPSGTGIVTVDGAGSTIRARAIYAGNGSLAVVNGGAIAASEVRISAYKLGEQATLTVADTGSLLSTGLLTIGTKPVALMETGEGSATVSNGGTILADDAIIGDEAGSTGSITVSGAGSSLSVAQLSNVSGNLSYLYVGKDGTGSVTIENGATLSHADINYLSNSRIYIGANNGSQGTVTVTGAGSTWDTDNSTIYLGYNGSAEGGHGELNISDGGTVNGRITAGLGSGGSGTVNISSGGQLISDGTNLYNAAVTVTGAGSTLDGASYSMIVGANNGAASVAVSDGGLVKSGFSVEVGQTAGSDGQISISGAGSSWDGATTKLYLGDYGTGSIDITAGGSMTNDLTEIGFKAGASGTALVSGAGSSWTMTQNLRVGAVGNGQLDIENGGSVSNLIGHIGYRVSSASTVNVDGSGSNWDNTRFIQVGFEGNGTLNVTNGGTVNTNSAAHTSYVGREAGSNGTVLISGAGSTLDSKGSMVVGESGTGTVTVENNGNLKVAGTLSTGAGGTINLTGGVLDSGTVDSSVGIFTMTGGTLNADAFIGDLNNTGGTVGPGHSPGIMTVTGAYSQDAASSLAIEIAGIIAGSEYDVLDVSGTATLGGTLDLLLDSEASISFGDTLDILTADVINGTFATINGLNISDNLHWEVSYDIDTVRITAVPIPAAAWLFGSALAGLGWFRRKQTV